ncbi:MAG: glycoside hydrolase family 3 C-terminal domain-containing protein [Bacteroidota bacterium]|nr:glycoside hydrolase family 3 C-terminal domain-containing protein [Bacteroidota bacterium]
MKKKLLALAVFLLPALVLQAQNLPQLGKAPVSKIVGAMTLEEKANLVVGTGMRMMGMPSGNAGPGAPGGQGARPAAAQAQQGPVIGQTQEMVAGAAGTTYSIPRLGIPAIVVADGPAGLRISPTRVNDKNTYYCTAFPVATLLASTWDVDLVNSVGKAMGNEVLEYGVDVILGPGMNIHRNPLCGRNFEYYSEDPFVAGKMGAAMVNGIESQGVGTSVKHYAANNAETNRNSLNTVVSQRALREIYLRGFGILVQESQPWTIMSSYNLINGTYAPQNYDLLTKVLRNDWGFKGLVMTDWFGGRDPVEMMKAGNDLLMPGTPAQSAAILAAVKEGKLDIKILDRNVERVLNLILQAPRFKGYKFSNKPDLKAHAEVTRQAADDGMVLLKNNSALPLAQEVKKIAAFGNTSYEIITGGTGSGDVNEAYSVSLVEGLQNAGYTVNENLQSMYASYLKASREGKPRSRGFMMGSIPITELAVNPDIVNSMVNVSDAAIITIGRNSGEGNDRKDVEGDFELSSAEREMIQLVSKTYQAKSKKVIVILNVGGVIETAGWKDYPDAILLAWQAGQETGNSIADVLSGKVNPSGKLATTFPVKYSDVPSAKNFPGKVLEKSSEKPSGEGDMMSQFMRPQAAEVTYEEGIYVGYRYYNTFNVPVSYEFGYGSSYTTFEYSNLKLSSTNFSKPITVTADIKNTGKVAGKEVAQLYIGAPAGKLDKPESELKGFVKTRLLQPGEVQTISFTINGQSLESFDEATSSWIADPGKYAVKVGSSCRDIRLNGFFTLGRSLTVKKESNALAPKVKINELKPGKAM